MKAILTRPYACAPEGHTVVKHEAGATVMGRVAEMALADGAAVEVREHEPFETKIAPPDETKAAPKKRARKG